MLILLACSPILFFMAALAVFKIPSIKAAPVLLGYTSVLALVFWGFPPRLLGWAIIEGAVFALWYIGILVFAAILLSDLLERTGASRPIKEVIQGITPSLPAAAVIVAWGLESLLEAMAGFGSGLVLPIVILTAMGLSPSRAAVCALLANSMPTVYGGVGMGMTITSSVSGVPLPDLLQAFNSLLFVPALVLPFLIARAAASSWKEVGRIALVPLCAFGGQRLAYMLPLGVPLNSILGGVFCFGGAVLGAKLLRFPEHHKIGLPPLKEILSASSSLFFAVFFILFTSRLNPPVHHWLRSFSGEAVIFPGAAPLAFHWFTDPGLFLLLSAVLGSLIMGAKVGTFIQSLKHVGGKIAGTLLVLLSILSLARVMSYSGMIFTLSEFLAQNLGIFYAGAAPLLGALASFTTGSITSAAVLMAALNAEMARALGLSEAKMVASFSAGATAFNMMTPHALAIVSAVLGTRKEEHSLMAQMFRYALPYLLGITFLSLLYHLL